MAPNEITKKEWINTIAVLLLFIIIITVGAIILLPNYWYLWLIIFVICLFLLVRWHTNKFAYRCPECSHEFRISILQDFISPHWPSKDGGRKYLKCPNCNKRTKAIVITAD